MSSKYAILSIYRVTSNFTFHQNVDVYNIVFDCDWLAISLFLWVYDRKTSWQNSKDLMGERRCGWKTHIAKKERLIIWCLAERHNTELRKGITLPSKKWMHHLLKDILPNSIFDERRQLLVLTLETKIIQKPTTWFELRNYVQVQNRKDMVNII